MAYDPEGGPIRAQLREFLEASNENQDEIDGAILTGFVTITEWAAPDGQPYLAILTGDTQGELPLPIWRIKGLCWYAAAEMAGGESYGRDEEDEEG